MNKRQQQQDKLQQAAQATLIVASIETITTNDRFIYYCKKCLAKLISCNCYWFKFVVNVGATAAA